LRPHTIPRIAFSILVAAGLVIVVVPGRTRTRWAILVAGASVAAAMPALLDVYSASGPRPVTQELSRPAAIAALASAAGAGLAWALLTAIAGRWAPRLRTPARGMLFAVAAATLVLAVVQQGAIRSTLATQYRAFVQVGANAQVDPERRGDEFTAAIGRWQPVRLLAHRLARLRRRPGARRGCRKL
jgi:hypothetical protein